MPYRIDTPHARAEAIERLIDLGAIDVELSPGGELAALLPDTITPREVAAAAGVPSVSVSPAVPRDDGSVWILGPRTIRVGPVTIAPADAAAAPGTIRLTDAAAFGTGLHPTTAMCLEALADLVKPFAPAAVLDVGTGSGILALAALTLGVPRALGLDVSDEALRAAAENARVNGLEARLLLSRGGPEHVAGTWPLVLANVLAAPLIEMAPALVRRVAREGRLVLCGIASAVERDVERTYRHLGMRRLHSASRDGWVRLVMQPSW